MHAGPTIESLTKTEEAETQVQNDGRYKTWNAIYIGFCSKSNAVLLLFTASQPLQVATNNIETGRFTAL